MITKTIAPTKLQTEDEIIPLSTRTPLLVLGWSKACHSAYPDSGDLVLVRLANGQEGIVLAEAVDSGIDGPEETMRGLEALTGVAYDALTKAARQGRLLARKSGNHWLSTERAVEYAIGHDYIRAPKRGGNSQAETNQVAKSPDY